MPCSRSMRPFEAFVESMSTSTTSGCSAGENRLPHGLARWMLYYVVGVCHGMVNGPGGKRLLL